MRYEIVIAIIIILVVTVIIPIIVWGIFKKDNKIPRADEKYNEEWVKKYGDIE